MYSDNASQVQFSAKTGHAFLSTIQSKPNQFMEIWFHLFQQRQYGLMLHHFTILGQKNYNTTGCLLFSPVNRLVHSLDKSSSKVNSRTGIY